MTRLDQIASVESSQMENLQLELQVFIPMPDYIEAASCLRRVRSGKEHLQSKQRNHHLHALNTNMLMLGPGLVPVWHCVLL